jgi:hypothetical protein
MVRSARMRDKVKGGKENETNLEEEVERRCREGKGEGLSGKDKKGKGQFSVLDSSFQMRRS